MLNKSDGIYFVKLHSPDPVDLLQEIWKNNPQKSYLQELTDRQREFRTTVRATLYGFEVLIYSHACDPKYDRKTLDPHVLQTLKGFGLISDPLDASIEIYSRAT